MSGSVAFRAPNALGDAVMATVVPAALRRAPDVERVSVVAPPGLADVFARSPAVDEVVESAPGREVDVYRSGRYDLVLLGPTSFGSAWRALRARRPACGFATAGRGPLLRRRLPAREYRRGRHQVENYRALAGLLGAPPGREEPAVALEPAWCEQARARWPGSGRPRVALQPGAVYGPAKRWPPERFARLARRLAAAGCDVGVLGGAVDGEVVRRVRAEAGGAARDLSGPMRVGVLAALLERADLVITNDTGPMHLAAAVGTRCLALFGSTSPVWTGPRGEGHRVLRGAAPCAPCFRRRCPIGTLCLARISVERVAREAAGMLEEGA